MDEFSVFNQYDVVIQFACNNPWLFVILLWIISYAIPLITLRIQKIDLRRFKKDWAYHVIWAFLIPLAAVFLIPSAYKASKDTFVRMLIIQPPLIEVEDIKMRVLSVDALIKTKKLMNRLRDKEAVLQLEAIKKLRKSKRDVL